MFQINQHLFKLVELGKAQFINVMVQLFQWFELQPYGEGAFDMGMNSGNSPAIYE